jgi:hypothetical protein
MNTIREGVLYSFGSVAPPALAGEISEAVKRYVVRFGREPLAITLHPVTYVDFGKAVFGGIPVGQDSDTPPGHVWMCVPEGHHAD